jgi:hypothetical protein
MNSFSGSFDASYPIKRSLGNGLVDPCPVVTLRAEDLGCANHPFCRVATSISVDPSHELRKFNLPRCTAVAFAKATVYHSVAIWRVAVRKSDQIASAMKPTRGRQHRYPRPPEVLPQARQRSESNKSPIF